MSDPFIGEIRMFPYTFAPVYWADCAGQQNVPISQFPALYAVINNTFGGNSQTMGLPNLQGSAPVGMGQGPGLSYYDWGERGGMPGITLTSSSQLPTHNHSAQMVRQASTTNSASGNYFTHVTEMTSSGSFVHHTYEAGTLPDSSMAPLSSAGTSRPDPHENRQPYLALRFCIALDGIFPPRP